MTTDASRDQIDALLAAATGLERPAQAELVSRIVAALAADSSTGLVREAALRLKPSERAELAHQLLLSLAALPEEQLAATWAIESRRSGGAASL